PVKILIRDMEIVASGNFDHRTRAHSNDEIGLMAVEFNEMTRRLAEAREREKEAMRVENDLALAKDVQRHILPPRPPLVKGFDIEANYTPALQLSGDFYDFIQLDRERLGIVVADVSGKSVPGALQMAITRTTLRFLAPHSATPSETLIKTNQVIAAEIKRGMFITVFYVILNARQRTIACSSAGHNPMVLVHASGQYELINPAGIALGFDKGPIFQRTIKEQTIQLASGDRVVLYTDGVVESMNSRNQEYGAQRFYEFCAAHRDLPSKEFVAKLIEDLDAHKGNADQHDDITIVTFKVN
ncbi:MAG: SpoIIE family protein phosphatase, partial [Planctomycetota bacterium]|nr:SpoIIE family protein phosphatase [Planctomycetota bacterium]